MKNIGEWRIVLLVVVMAMKSAVGDFQCEIVVVNGAAHDGGGAYCEVNGHDVGGPGPGPMDPNGTDEFFVQVSGKQRTVMTCTVTLGNRYGKYNLFDSDLDSDNCSRAGRGLLYWRIDENGLFINKNRQFVKRYNWT